MDSEAELDCDVGAFLERLGGEPLLCVGLEQDPSRVRVDVLAAHQVRGHSRGEAVRIDFALEALVALLAVRTAPADPI